MKNKMTAKDTAAIADLAKLSFNGEQLLAFEKDMNDIIGFAAKIAEITDKSTPERERTTVTREDLPLSANSSGELQKVFPACEDGFILVPKAVE